MQIRRLVTSHSGHKMMQNHKKRNVSEDVFSIELKHFTVLILIKKFHDMAHCDVSIATKWAPGSLHPKGEISVSLPVLEIIFLYSEDMCPFKSSFWSDI